MKDKKTTPRVFSFKAIMAATIMAVCILYSGKTSSQTTFRLGYSGAYGMIPISGGMVQNPAGEFVFAGSNTFGGVGDITRIDNAGNIIWAKSYAPGFFPMFNDIKNVSAANGGGYIATGGSSSGGAVLVRVDNSGNLLWAYKYQYPNHSSKTSNEYANAVAETSDGGFIVGGSVEYFWDGVSPSTVDTSTAFGFKVNSTGILQWNKVWKTPTAAGNYDKNYINAVVETIDGYIFVGAVSDVTQADNSNGDKPKRGLIIKTNKATGALTYINIWGSGTTFTEVNSAIILSDGNVLIGGNDSDDGFIAKIAGAGGAPSITFSKKIHEDTGFPFYFTKPWIVRNVMQNSDGNYSAITMRIDPLNPTAMMSTGIIKMNASTGAIMIKKTYPGVGPLGASILPEGGLATADQGYFAVMTDSDLSAQYIISLFKTDANGNAGPSPSSCVPSSPNPTSPAYTISYSTPTLTEYTSMTGSAITPVVATINPVQEIFCLTVPCIPPAAATTVTATPNPICAGLTTQITASGPATGVSYNVYAAATGGASLGATPYTTPALTGNTTYYVETVNNSDPACVSITRTTVTVTVNTPTTTTFTALGPYCIGAIAGTLSTTSNNGITETWSPSTISTASAGTTTYTFTPTAGLCATTATMNITINANTTPTFTVLGPYCIGATPGTLPTTSNNAITGTWSPATVSTASVGTITYTFTPTVGLCATTATMNVTVNTIITPTFTVLGPYCVGATPGTLPTTSNNGVTGTWSPVTVSTASAGTTTYTFTPSAVSCATTTTMDITINVITTPTYSALGPYCVGATPGTLAATSINGITGTWSPSTVSTASVGTTTYTFTPTAGLCATTATMDITINTSVTPTFTALGPYCVGATPGTLPATSNNAITGIWSPATVSTASASTTTYTFTPSASCATTTTMDITVNTITSPTFTALGPYCIGATPGTLPTTSINGVTGIWSPSTISTASAGPATYTFTPTAGLCATTATMSVTVSSSLTPTFTVLGPYCVGATPGTLPTTSTNGVTGAWSPATVSIASAGTTTYTFTPSVGSCATTTTMNITVNANTAPTFTVLGPYCIGATPGTLPTTSNNSVTGTWSPATISTASAGTTTYTFTPAGGSCGSTTTMNITVNANTVPTFTVLGPYCMGAIPSTLPTTSNNGITGTWSPPIISTASAGATTYTFTPTSGLCATIVTMSVTITANTIPTFTALGPHCTGATPGTLPTTSNNGVTGTWSPATVSTANPGTTTYTFTPTIGSCAIVTTLSIIVTAPPTATITGSDSVCIGQGTILTANGGSPYLWSNGQTTQSIAVTPISATTYNVIIGTGCTGTATINVNVNALPVPGAGPNATITQFTSTTLIASGGGTYLWTPSTGLNCDTCTKPIAHPATTTQYCVAVTNASGCIDTACVTVTVDFICNEVFVPTAFSPNADNQNDVLFVNSNCITDLDFVIFDRWGEKVFETNDVTIGWDGTLKGKPLDTDVFAYYLRGNLKDKAIDLHGNITLTK